jgi:excisionase family DNA binding protein
MGTDDAFWTVKQAARFLNVSPYTLRRYLKRNKKTMPPIHHPVCKQIRIPKEEFIQWAMQQRGK